MVSRRFYFKFLPEDIVFFTVHNHPNLVQAVSASASYLWDMLQGSYQGMLGLRMTYCIVWRRVHMQLDAV